MLKAAGIWEVGRVLPGVDTGQALRGDTTFSPWALPFSGFALLYGFTLGPSLAQLHGADRLDVIMHHGPLIALAALAAAVPMLVALSQLSRRRWIIILWVAVPVVGVVLLATRNIKPFNVRYLASVLPWLVVLMAAGLARLAVWPRRVLAAALFGLSLASLAGLFWVGDYAKADIRGAVAVVTREATPRTVLAPTVGPVVRHYLGERMPVKGCWDESILATPADADGLVARQLAGVSDAWYLRARAWDLDPHGRIPDALRRVGTLERVDERNGVTLDRWRRHDEAVEVAP